MQLHDSLRLILCDGMTDAPLKPDGYNELVSMPQIPEGICPYLADLKIFGSLRRSFDCARGKWRRRRRSDVFTCARMRLRPPASRKGNPLFGRAGYAVSLGAFLWAINNSFRPLGATFSPGQSPFVAFPATLPFVEIRPRADSSLRSRWARCTA